MEIVQENCGKGNTYEGEDDGREEDKDLFKQKNGTPSQKEVFEVNNGVDVTKILLDPTNDVGVVEGWDQLLQERCINIDLDKGTDNPGSKGQCHDRSLRLGLRHPSTWKVFDLKFPKGLILIKNPFTPEGQRYWIKRSVIDFPFQFSHITNIDNLENKEGKFINKEKRDRDEFFKKLRWVTFGYHHNWDTKVYSEDEKCEFPPDLANLTKFMADVLGFPDFKAEASIANYYHLDSTLSGHVDKSEANQNAPLFSLSFGQPAVFLIGGRSKTIKPQAIILQSGDIAVMSGESRLSFHGVPKIFQTDDEPWTSPASILPDSPDCSSSNKRPKLDADYSYPDSLNVDWSSFLSRYVCNSRINLNIRQVLFPGLKTLVESHAFTANQ